MTIANLHKDDLPFQGLKVLDLSSVLAGPLTGSFFSELGAEVIKIENLLTNGDATRQWKLPSEDPENPYSAYYFSANYKKEIRLMDLTDSEHRAQLESLLSTSDLVISNFQKNTSQKLGLLPDEILLKFPHLIYAQLCAYDFDDPRPGYDLVMQGETGWISMNGSDQNHLAKLPVAIIDILAAHQMKEAILIAMLKKMKTGLGSIVYVSLYKSAISALANQASNYLMQGHIPRPIGTLHPNIAPYGDQYISKDGIRLLLAIGSDAQFKKLWFSLNLPSDKLPTFELNSDRLTNRDLLNDILQARISLSNIEELKSIFATKNIPYCCLYDLKSVFEDIMATEMINIWEYDEIEAKSVSSIAFRFPKPQ